MNDISLRLRSVMFGRKNIPANIFSKKRKQKKQNKTKKEEAGNVIK